MDQELSKQLQQTLSTLLVQTQDAASWAKSQLPVLIQEKIFLGRIEETIQLVLLLVAFVVAIKLFLFCFRCAQDDSYDDWGVGAVLSVIPVAATFILVCLQLHYAVMAWFTPRLYIMEWLLQQIHK